MTDVIIKTTENVSKIIKLGVKGPPGIGLNVIAASVSPIDGELIFTLGDYSTISAGYIECNEGLTDVEQVGNKLVFALENGVVVTSSTISFGVSTHSELNNLQGGTISEYYHLDNSLYGIVSSLSVNNGKLIYDNSTIGIYDHSQLTNLNSSSYSHVSSSIANILSSLSVTNNNLLFNGNTIGVTEASQLLFTPSLGITATNSESAIYQTYNDKLDITHLDSFDHDDISHTNRNSLDLVTGTNSGDQDLSGLLPIIANTYTEQNAPFTISSDMLGKDVPVTFATDEAPGITLPPLDVNGYWLEGGVSVGGIGFQVKIKNLSSTNKTFSGTLPYSSGTKMPPYSDRVISVINGPAGVGWSIGGLTT